MVRLTVVTSPRRLVLSLSSSASCSARKARKRLMTPTSRSIAVSFRKREPWPGAPVAVTWIPVNWRRRSKVTGDGCSDG